MSERRHSSGIDVFRIIAAVMVVAIHTYPLADISATAEFVVTRIICRVAVPFFFMTSGFFLISEYAKDTAKLKKFIIKTAVVYAIAIIIYIPVNIYNGYFNAERLLPEIIQDIIFDGTMYHLWYLPASMIGACIAWFLVRRLKFKKAIIVSAALYMLGLLGDSYYGVAERVGAVKSIYDSMFQIFEYTRNGIFFAPVFFVMGGYASGKEQTGNGRNRMLLLMFFDMMLVEGLLLDMLGFQRHDSMYIFLVPCVYYLLRCLAEMNGKRRKELSRASLIIYLIHPMVIVAVRLAAKLSGLEKVFVDNNLIHFAAVTVISCAFAFLFVRVFKQKKTETQLRAWRETELSALDHNAYELQRACPEGCSLMAVVKADAYGHGAFEVSTELEKHGVNAFAVATIDEGIELRKFGIRGEVLVLGYTAPERAGELKKYDLIQTVVSAEHAEALNSRKVKLKVHIKTDTGMHRLGFDANDTESILKCFEYENLKVTGIYSHLCVSDCTDEESDAFTRLQIDAFKRVLDAVKDKNVKVHLQSSYGLLNYPDVRCDYVRAGIALYGVHSSLKDSTRLNVPLKPVMSLKAKVVQVRKIAAGETAGYGRCFKAKRESLIATVSIGYADGVPRELSGKGSVMINGCTAPIVGRICMDQLSVDVTDIPDVKTGDIVTVIGDGISAEQTAECAGTITNELLSRMGKRLDIITV